MKSTVEQLSPTRVRINVEVPFDELKPDFDRAYKELAKQVRLPGFRPGKAPARVLEARLGRGIVLEQVLEHALPARYGQAVVSSELQVVGHPDIDVTAVEDGQLVTFTAEVDVRPELTLPELSQIAITVAAPTVTDDDVEEQLMLLRQRFGTLRGVQRAAREGDFVSIDMSATIDGKAVDDATATGVSHEVGSGRLIDGLDAAVAGLSADESKVFTAELVAGDHAGKPAEVTVLVRAVKERDLPEADDEFAQLASEFDTIAELREDLRRLALQQARMGQVGEIRDKLLQALLQQLSVPLPAEPVQEEITIRTQTALYEVDNDEAKFAVSLQARGTTREEFDQETKAAAEEAVRHQLVMDAVAEKYHVAVGEQDMTERIMSQARRYGMAPQTLVQRLQEAGQIPALFADVRRDKALVVVADQATVTDSSGAEVDTVALFGKPETLEPSETDEAEPAGESDTDAAEPTGEATDSQGGHADPAAGAGTPVAEDAS